MKKGGVMQNTANFKEIISGICFIISLLFSLISLNSSVRAHSLRILGVLLIAGLSIFSENVWCYFGAIFIIGTAVTELDFLQKLAAIIRGRKDYFEYEMKRLEFMSGKEVEENIKREVEEIDESNTPNESSEQGTNDINQGQKGMNSIAHIKTSKSDAIRFALRVEDYVIRYIEKKYQTAVKRNIKLRVDGSSSQVDGLLELPSKVVLIEVKTTRRDSLPMDIIYKSYNSLYKAGIQSRVIYNKEIELKFVLVGNFRSIFKERIKSFIEENKNMLDITIDFEIYSFADLEINEDEFM